MLMVVLGAGASADAVNGTLHPFDDAMRPPLASELFGNRARFNAIALQNYPQALPAILHLRQRVVFGGNVEAELAKLQAGADGYPSDRRAIAGIRFYLQEIIEECGRNTGGVGFTNFVSLVRQLDMWRHGSDEPVIYVTFNYDTLLEQACFFALDRLTFESMPDYVADPRVTLLKLHGSINWWHPIEEVWPDSRHGEPRGWIIDNIDSLTVLPMLIQRAPGAPLGEPVGTEHGPVRQLLLPAIAIPVERKPHFEADPAHEARLREVLPRIDKVITVGWRAQELHFLDLLRDGGLRKDATCLVVTKSVAGANEVRERLRAHVGLGDCAYAGHDFGGFSGLVAGDILAQFLGRVS